MRNGDILPDDTAFEVAAACGALLGEGPIYDSRVGAVLFVDIKGRCVYRLDVAEAAISAIEVDEPVGFVALTPDPDVVVAGFAKRLVLLDLIDKTVHPLVELEPDRPGNRCNDGWVGPDGTLWLGTQDDGEEAETGAFYAFDGKRLHRLADGVAIANGPAFSPGGDTLYAVDTVRKRILAYDLPDGRALAADGSGLTADRPRVFADLSDLSGNPDGLAVDVAGRLWLCLHGEGAILRLAPDGSREETIRAPTANVTKCAFGGADLDILYLTTAARGAPNDPLAGHLFRMQTDTRGLPITLFLPPEDL